MAKTKLLEVPESTEIHQLNEFEIRYKTKASTKAKDLTVITHSGDAVKVLMNCYEEGAMEWRECFVVLALNHGNKVLGHYKVSTGGITGTVADPRIILQFALMSNACNLILSHNHPSGSTKPSKADEELTNKIKQAALFFDIKVLDHIIVTSDGYFSFSDKGML